MSFSSKLPVLTRSLATAGGEAVKVPLQVFGLEGRYATALYTAAIKLNQIDAVEKELGKVQDAMKKSQTLRDGITSPIINKKVMATSLKEAAAKASFSSATTNLLELLAENGRLKKIDNVINSFKSIMAAHRGEVVCEVTTAKPLDGGQRKQLEDALKKFIKPNETILLNTKEDPSIIGGMVVSIGDKYVDMSISSKIKKYTDLISASA